jgi:hypothetical protein
MFPLFPLLFSILQKHLRHISVRSGALLLNARERKFHEVIISLV